MPYNLFSSGTSGVGCRFGTLGWTSPLFLILKGKRKPLTSASLMMTKKIFSNSGPSFVNIIDQLVQWFLSWMTGILWMDGKSRSDNFLKSTDIILISTAPTNDDVSIPIDRSAIRNKSLSKYLMSRQTGQKLLITRQLLRSFRSQPVGCDLTFSLLYEYAYKNTSNPFEQDSCKLGSVVLEGD
ncbi:hypothetical protein T459_18171 [Capsicum annuum]|uniref:Uncharacterized protein n=1 Tax=Capsicum annuum TaxID=4072 RepID=A0A2G2ZDP5_CAPAN|nr:hypothetical protein T459_18171 [Capsicum annuum]